jgi:hypothetical protein
VGGACAIHGTVEKSVQGFVRKPEGRIPLRRPRLRWEDGTRMDSREIG